MPSVALTGSNPTAVAACSITDVIGARLLHVAASGQTRVLAKFSGGGADFGYIGAKRIAVVPFLAATAVSAYDLTASLK